MLSHRLKSLGDWLESCDTLADIGSDHAYLPIYLLKNDKIQQALIIEINEKPLKKAIDMTIKEKVNEQCRFFLSNGLRKVNVLASTYVLAGMGSETILDIIHQDIKTFRKANQIVIQSNSKWSFLRKKMHQLGFNLLDEKLILDRKKEYLFLKYKYAKVENYTSQELNLGPYLMKQGTLEFINSLKLKVKSYSTVQNFLEEDKKEWLKHAQEYLSTK